MYYLLLFLRMLIGSNASNSIQGCGLVTPVTGPCCVFRWLHPVYAYAPTRFGKAHQIGLTALPRLSVGWAALSSMATSNPWARGAVERLVWHAVGLIINNRPRQAPLA